jgi:CheY-like chemotaxis protein
MSESQTVLLVDDSENDLLLLRRAFKKGELNFSQREVHNGEEAIAYLSGEGVYADRIAHPLPCLILLDLNMPMKSGFEVLEWIAAQPPLRRLATIVLTASLRQEDVLRAFKLGATAYLVKPSNLQALADMVRSLSAWTKLNHFPPLNEMVLR